MFSSQISRILKSDPYTSKHFAGVFPSDLLPTKRITKFPYSLVANTDDSSKKGEHWVCFYFDRNGVIEYFDSYGLPPVNMNLFNFIIKNIKHSRKHGAVRRGGGGEGSVRCNDVQLQGLGTVVCGHYCIAFLARRSRGESMKEIVESYRGREPGSKDHVVRDVVNKIYGTATLAPLQYGGSSSSSSSSSSRDLVEQCCCSLSHSKLGCSLIHFSTREAETSVR